MLPYIISFVISCILFAFAKEGRQENRNILSFLGILPTAIIAGCRDISIGTDTDNYPYFVFLECRHANSLSSAFRYIGNMVEKFYVYLAYFSSRVSDDFNMFLFLCHLLMLGTLLVAFRKFKINVAIAFSFFYLILFATSLNAARQFLAIPFCLLSLAFFTQKKIVMAAISMFIAYGFHHSSLFFVVIHLLYFASSYYYVGMSSTRNQLLISFAIVFGIVFLAELLEVFVGWGVADNKYLTRYGDSEKYGSSFPRAMFVLTCFNYFIMSVLVKNKEKTPFLLFTKYVMQIAILFCLSGLVSTFAARLNLYFIITSTVCLAYVLRMCRYRYLLEITSVYMLYWFLVVTVANLGETYPYTSIILGI